MKRILFKGSVDKVVNDIARYLNSKAIDYSKVTVDIKHVNNNTATGVLIIAE